MITLKQRWEKQRTDERHHNWRGDEASYFSIHRWVYARLGKPVTCSQCGATKEEVTIQWANISGEYKRDLSDFKPLCLPCHKRYDRFKRYGNKCRNGHDLTDPQNLRVIGVSKRGVPYIGCKACRRTPEYRAKVRARRKGIL
jgi:hypothetical protein